MSLSCSNTGMPCIPTAQVTNVNSQLCPSPESNVVIMQSPRLYNAVLPWMNMYAQTNATTTLSDTNTLPVTYRMGTPGHDVIQNQRVIRTPANTTSVVSNMGFSMSPSVGGFVQALTADTFVPPSANRLNTNHQSPGLGTGVSNMDRPFNNRSVQATNPSMTYNSILSSPIPYPKN